MAASTNTTPKVLIPFYSRSGTIEGLAKAVAEGAGAPAHVLLGALLINMKNYAAAEPELATAARLDPRNAEARRMLALLRKTAAERNAR